MKIQANHQTKDGVWGVQLTGWATPLAPVVFSKWLTHGEWDALVASIAADQPNGVDAPKGGE